MKQKTGNHPETITRFCLQLVFIRGFRPIITVVEQKDCPLCQTINRRRFAGHDRRQAIDAVPDSEIAAYFGIGDEQMASLRESRISHISVNEEGQIVNVEASIINMDDESARSVGPEGAVADNETENDNDENEAMIQRSV